MRLTISGDGARFEHRASHAWAEVLDEFAAVDAAMSRFRRDSEVTRLNETAGVERTVLVSTRLRKALAISERARRMTGGRFDARVLRALEAIGYCGAPLLHAGGGPTDPGPCSVRGPSVTVGRSGVVLSEPVDLGGIGKGLALRWAASRMRRRFPEATFLLEAGGDIVAHGEAPEGGAWRVGIEDPWGTGEQLAVLTLAATRAVATSSVRRNRWERDGHEVHHLIDPRSGAPAEASLRAVTVAAHDPAWAEVWSKALFVTGAEAIGEVARERGLAAWWTDGTTLAMTPAARPMTVWTRYGR